MVAPTKLCTSNKCKLYASKIFCFRLNIPWNQLKQKLKILYLYFWSCPKIFHCYPHFIWYVYSSIIHIIIHLPGFRLLITLSLQSLSNCCKEYCQTRKEDKNEQSDATKDSLHDFTIITETSTDIPTTNMLHSSLFAGIKWEMFFKEYNAFDDFWGIKISSVWNNYN